jgi:hypothetical protein
MRAVPTAAERTAVETTAAERTAVEPTVLREVRRPGAQVYP